MKLKSIIMSAAALVVGLSGTAFATTNYTPTERVHCTLNDAGKLTCSDINRTYLTESVYTADMETGVEKVFTFSAGAAFKSSTNEWAVFYAYKSPDGKNVKLKTINTSFAPDLVGGSWTAVKDFYTCTAGYMNCPIIVS